MFLFWIKPKAVWPGAGKKNDKKGNSKTNKLQEKCNNIHFKPTILSLEDYFGGSVSPFLGFYLTYFWEMIFPVYRTHVTLLEQSLNPSLFVSEREQEVRPLVSGQEGQAQV